MSLSFVLFLKLLQPMRPTLDGRSSVRIDSWIDGAFPTIATVSRPARRTTLRDPRDLMSSMKACQSIRVPPSLAKCDDPNCDIANSHLGLVGLREPSQEYPTPTRVRASSPQLDFSCQRESRK